MQLIDSAALLDRSLYLASAPSASALALELASATPYFALFLAWDSRSTADSEIVELSETLMERGIAYLVSWALGVNASTISLAWLKRSASTQDRPTASS
jgi:hypothetical protein